MKMSFKTLNHINALNTFNYPGCIDHCMLNMLISSIQTLLYVAKSKFLLPCDANPIGTHYVIFKIKNVVELVENVDIVDT